MNEPRRGAQTLAADPVLQRDDEHARLLKIVIILPTDYTEVGGTIERWADPNLPYPDCSGGCKWARWLGDHKEGDGLSLDWLVCAHPTGPRRGLLTYEHQSGSHCGWEPDEEYGPGEIDRLEARI